MNRQADDGNLVGEVEGDRAIREAVKDSLGQPGGEPAVEVRKPPFQGVLLVQPDRDPSAVSQQPREFVERRSRVWRVMQHADAEDEVERFSTDWQLEYVRLPHVERF